MLLLLDVNRKPVREIDMYQAVTMSVRFSRPSLIELLIPENSKDLLSIMKEGMYVYSDKYNRIFLIEYIKREVASNDSKSFVVKGTSVEGFWAQRIAYTKKEYEGTGIQDVIRELLEDNVLNPKDTRRKLDFFDFVETDNPIVLESKVKTIVEDISVMEAITALLESKNLGYEAVFNIVTGRVSFKIVPGVNRCPDYVSTSHGNPTAATVLLSVESETVQDLRSVVDLSIYKTRVIVSNFDKKLVFDRVHASGMDLREGVLKTSYGNLNANFTEPSIPSYPEFVPPEMPPEVPVEPPPPQYNLLGMYVLTNKSRLLATAFYPGTPVPDVWFDVTPEENPQLTTRGAVVLNNTGTLLFVQADHKKAFAANMTGGWFGSRFFTQAQPFFEAYTIGLDTFPEYEPSTNIIGGFGVNPITGEIAATLTSPWITGDQATHQYLHCLVRGDTNGLVLASDKILVYGQYPGLSGTAWPFMSLGSNGEIIHSNIGIFWIDSNLCVYESGVWVDKKTVLIPGVNTYDRSFHYRPDPASSLVFFGNVENGVSKLYRSMSGCMDGVYQEWSPAFPIGWADQLSFVPDGSRIISRVQDGYDDRVNMHVINPTDLSLSVQTRHEPMLFESTTTVGNIAHAVFAGYNSEGTIQWGILTRQRPGYLGTKSTFYLTDQEDMSGLVEVAPLLDEFLRYGPFGVDDNDDPIEWPVHCWPILG